MNRILVYGMVGTNRGGIETYLLKMNQYMSENTVFDYVIEEDSCLHEEAIQQKGGKIYYITKRSKNPLRNILDNRALLRSLRGEVAAVYFNLSSLSWIIPIKLALSLGYKVFVHSHNSKFIAANSSLLHRSVNYLSKRILSGWNVNRLTCSKFATDFMFRSGDDVEMVYNAIKTQEFAFDSKVRNQIRLELAVDDMKVIGYVGRLSEEKNPLYLAEIMNAVKKQRDDVFLLALGDGPMRKQLEERIAAYGLQDKCKLLGNVKNVNEYMQAMDVLVLPSLHEGLPYVIVEAQTAGLHCFITDTITPEVNISGNVHFLPLTEDAYVWRDAICASFSSNAVERRAVGEFMDGTNFNIKNEAIRLEKMLTM